MDATSKLIEWEEQEMNKCRLLYFVMTCVLGWVGLSIQLMLPKSEVRAMSILEMRLMFLNILCLFIILVFLVYKVERQMSQVLNYALFYVLFVTLQLPHYGIPLEVFIPSWVAGCMLYILIAVATESAPFLKYPERTYQSHRLEHYKEVKKMTPISTITSNHPNIPKFLFNKDTMDSTTSKND